jgi:hypothetical protein
MPVPRQSPVFFLPSRTQTTLRLDTRRRSSAHVRGVALSHSLDWHVTLWTECSTRLDDIPLLASVTCFCFLRF